MDMDDDSMAAIGFMFDASHSRVKKTVPVADGISLQLTLIGEDPGHVQSGQYLWPAALFASQHLVENWDILGRGSILELGSGCGLTGLTTAKLPGTNRVVLTDYDPGCLTILQENYETNARTQELTSLPSPEVDIRQYSWGSNDISFRPLDGFGLIIGSDLLYCQEVVRPLIKSVNAMINNDDGIFILVSSFDVGEV